VANDPLSAAVLSLAEIQQMVDELFAVNQHLSAPILTGILDRCKGATMTRQVSPQGLSWFQDARFGMFVHWGLYSILGKQEWVMHTDRIPVPEYEKLALQFNPTKFDADAWVRTAADAGQKYIVVTSRHHDGFSMYDTALSDYKVTNSPFRRDPIAELAKACSQHGVKLGFYVSLLDWHHPAYRFRARKWAGLGRLSGVPARPGARALHPIRGTGRALV
jgi:hypothetical protein